MCLWRVSLTRGHQLARAQLKTSNRPRWFTRIDSQCRRHARSSTSQGRKKEVVCWLARYLLHQDLLTSHSFQRACWDCNSSDVRVDCECCRHLVCCSLLCKVWRDPHLRWKLSTPAPGKFPTMWPSRKSSSQTSYYRSEVDCRGKPERRNLNWRRRQECLWTSKQS